MNILATIVDLKASNSICAHALVLRECLERPGLFRARDVRGVCSLVAVPSVFFGWGDIFVSKSCTVV